MGPYPHDAPPASISAENPAGTDGFEFVEFAHPEPAKLEEVFARMGYAPVARHKSKNITLWRQGDITYALNAEPGSFGMGFAEAHGPCAPAMAWRVVDAEHAFRHAVAKGATPYEGGGKVLDVPAIMGIGGSLLYFVDTYGAKGSAYAQEYDWLGAPDPKPAGVGFYYLDHLTHNVHRGNMDTWFRFYGELFGFRQIRFFDIAGKYTGLHSRALTSPCGRIRIPINEDRGETGQIVEYLKRYKGEGIQHIAVGSEDIYAATDAIAERGLKFMPPPPAVYYELSHERVKGHAEPRRAHAPARHPDRRRGGGGRRRDPHPVADFLEDHGRADLLRVHPAQGRRRLRRGQFPGALRVDRGRPDRPGGAEAGRRMMRLPAVGPSYRNRAMPKVYDDARHMEPIWIRYGIHMGSKTVRIDSLNGGPQSGRTESLNRSAHETADPCDFCACNLCGKACAGSHYTTLSHRPPAQPSRTRRPPAQRAAARPRAAEKRPPGGRSAAARARGPGGTAQPARLFPKRRVV